MEKTNPATKHRPAFKKIPRFVRQNRAIMKRVGAPWRKPRGIDNKQRVQIGGTGALPKIGYRKPRAQRGIHPCGLPEKLVHNVAQISVLEKGKTVARIGAAVGAKKRVEIIRKAREMGLRVLNG